MTYTAREAIVESPHQKRASAGLRRNNFLFGTPFPPLPHQTSDSGKVTATTQYISRFASL